MCILINIFRQENAFKYATSKIWGILFHPSGCRMLKKDLHTLNLMTLSLIALRLYILVFPSIRESAPDPEFKGEKDIHCLEDFTGGVVLSKDNIDWSRLKTWHKNGYPMTCVHHVSKRIFSCNNFIIGVRLFIVFIMYVFNVDGCHEMCYHLCIMRARIYLIIVYHSVNKVNVISLVDAPFSNKGLSIHQNVVYFAISIKNNSPDMKIPCHSSSTKYQNEWVVWIERKCSSVLPWLYAQRT